MQHSRLLCFLILFISVLLASCVAVEQWSQVGRDAQNTRRTVFSSSSPQPWKLTLPSYEFISGGFESINYHAVDGESGSLFLTLRAADWRSSTLFEISLQDGSIRNSFSFNTTCNYLGCPFDLSYGKNNVLSSNGDIISEFLTRPDPKAVPQEGVTSFSISESGQGSRVWSFLFPDTVRDQSMEPVAVTPSDVVILAQYSPSTRYTITGVQYLQKAAEPAWSLSLGNAAVTAPAVDDDGHIYINYNGTKILRIDGKTGEVVSTTAELPEDIPNLLGYDHKPAVGSKRVYTVANNPSVYKSIAIVGFSNDLSAGSEQQLLWKKPLYIPPPSPTYDYPYSCNSIVVAPSSDKQGSDTIFVVCSHPNATVSMAYALDGATGEQLWYNQVSRVPDSRLNCNSASLSNGNKYLAIHCLQMFDGSLQIVVLEAATGKLVNTLTADSSLFGFSFLDSDDYVYFGYLTYESSRNTVHIDKIHLLERQATPKLQVGRRVHRN